MLVWRRHFSFILAKPRYTLVTIILYTCVVSLQLPNYRLIPYYILKNRENT